MSSEYIDKQGFTKVMISSQAAMEAPIVESFRQGDIYAYSSLVPYDYKTATRVHFVSDNKGNEYGQFSSEALANECARIVANTSENEIHRYFR